MRALSERTRDFSQQIRSQIGTVHELIHGTETAIGLMASHDVAFASRGQRDLEVAIAHIRTSHDTTAANAATFGALAGEVRAEVDKALAILDQRGRSAEEITRYAHRIGEAQRLAAGCRRRADRSPQHDAQARRSIASS